MPLILPAVSKGHQGIARLVWILGDAPTEALHGSVFSFKNCMCLAPLNQYLQTDFLMRCMALSKMQTSSYVALDIIFDLGEFCVRLAFFK
jgi:hypothetical protein